MWVVIKMIRSGSFLQQSFFAAEFLCGGVFACLGSLCGQSFYMAGVLVWPVSGHVPCALSTTLPSGPSSNVSEPSTCSSGHSPNFLDFECDPGLALLLPPAPKCSKDLLNPPPPISPWNCNFLTFLSTLGHLQEFL